MVHFGQLLKNHTIRYDFIKKFIYNKKILTETGILVNFYINWHSIIRFIIKG